MTDKVQVLSPERTEFAVMIDCDKNGCAEPHADNGWVSPFSTTTLDDLLAKYGQEPKINGHAASVVWRTVPGFVAYDMATVSHEDVEYEIVPPAQERKNLRNVQAQIEPSWVESIRLRHSTDPEVSDALDELIHRRAEVSEQRSLLLQKDTHIEKLESAIRGLSIPICEDGFRHCCGGPRSGCRPTCAIVVARQALGSNGSGGGQ